MFEDGDFDLPSVYVKDTESEKLLICAGQTVALESKAIRMPETAFNVIALGIAELIRENAVSWA